jgi:hypothetical protein
MPVFQLHILLEGVGTAGFLRFLVCGRGMSPSLVTELGLAGGWWLVAGGKLRTLLIIDVPVYRRQRNIGTSI